MDQLHLLVVSVLTCQGNQWTDNLTLPLTLVDLVCSNWSSCVVEMDHNVSRDVPFLVCPSVRQTNAQQQHHVKDAYPFPVSDFVNFAVFIFCVVTAGVLLPELLSLFCTRICRT